MDGGVDMNRTESYASLETHTISMDMVRSTIDVYSYDTDTIQLLVSGDDASVSLMHLEWNNGKLMLSMPMRDRVPNPIAAAWMQIVLRLPRDWKGALTLKSQSGSISVNGYTGTDFVVSTTSGHIRAEDVECLTADLHSISGILLMKNSSCETAKLSTVSGNMLGENVKCHTGRLSTVSGSTEIILTAPFQQLSGNSVSGDTHISVPLRQINATFKSVTGRILTNGVSIQEAGPELHFNSVTGNLVIEGNDAPQEV